MYFGRLDTPRTHKAIEERAASVRVRRDLLPDLPGQMRTESLTPAGRQSLAVTEVMPDLRPQRYNQNVACKVYLDSDDRWHSGMR